MGMFFDNVGITNQASSAAAGRLDQTLDFQAGGAGPRGSTIQNFVFGRGNQLDASGQAGTTAEPPWLWIVVLVVALAVTWAVFRRGG